MSYACIGTTETGARCRNEAAPSKRCEECTEKNRPGAPAPTHILLKLVINERRAKAFANTGVSTVQPNWGERREQHQVEAYVHGMDAKAYATETYKGVDSGTAVFGRQGLSDVCVEELWAELHSLGFVLQDIHLERNRKGNDILVIALAKGAENKFPSLSVGPLVKDLLAFDWGFVHVWANPVRPDASVVHTVNCAGMKSPGDRHTPLEFSKGLWGIPPTA